MARLSSALRAGRADHGEDPAALGRADIETFLQRLAFLAADGQLSAYGRVRTCQDAGVVLAEIRAQGLTRQGGPANGLADDFTLAAGDVPAKADPGEPGRDIPAEIMRQICAHLPELEQAISSRETRVAVEWPMDTGRRPAEICALTWDCVARAADGTPVLVYDSPWRGSGPALATRTSAGPGADHQERQSVLGGDPGHSVRASVRSTCRQGTSRAIGLAPLGVGRALAASA